MICINTPLPLVSCICPTYGRFPNYGHLLNETVACYLFQDYPEDKRQLLILNDCPDQVLVCSKELESRGVHVINLTERISSLGVKYNTMITLAKGDVIFPWEDDDISLPQRISQGIQMLLNICPDIQWDRDSLYWKPPQVWYYEHHNKTIYHKHAVGVRHHASCFTREAWKRIGGYSPVSGNQDAEMDRRLRGDLLPKYPDGISPSEWQYIYRWGVSPNHLSAFRNTEKAYEQESNKKHAKGVFRIEPDFSQNWQSLINAHLVYVESAERQKKTSH